jgi:SAM-dependent methyltransferase
MIREKRIDRASAVVSEHWLKIPPACAAWLPSKREAGQTMLLAGARFLLKAIRSPEPDRHRRSVARNVLLKPRAFEFVATLLQLRDFTRTRALPKTVTPAPTSTGDYYDRWADYNLQRTLSRTIVTARAAENILPALVLPGRDHARERLLIIGPRTIQEIYLCWLYGFAWKNITAIDLFSTNPKIEVMNMEQMTFPSGTFDSVLASNTVTYAKDLGACFKEIARVMKPGARFAFTHSHFPDSTGDLDTMRVPEDMMLSALREAGLRPYFHSRRVFQNSLGGTQTAHHVAVEKIPAADQ